MDGFEVFTRALIARARPPQVSITKAGAISMNAAAYALIGSPEHVQVSFAPHESSISIRASTLDSEASLPVRAAKNSPNGPYVVSAIAQLRDHGFTFARTSSWPARTERDELLVDFDEAPASRSANQRGKPLPDGSRRRPPRPLSDPPVG